MAPNEAGTARDQDRQRATHLELMRIIELSLSIALLLQQLRKAPMRFFIALLSLAIYTC